MNAIWNFSLHLHFSQFSMESIDCIQFLFQIDFEFLNVKSRKNRIWMCWPKKYGLRDSLLLNVWRFFCLHFFFSYFITFLLFPFPFPFSLNANSGLDEQKIYGNKVESEQINRSHQTPNNIKLQCDSFEREICLTVFVLYIQ